jgi:hypothetical protein
MRDVQVFAGIQDVFVGVATAVLPLVAFFLTFQLLLLRLPRRYVASILKGTLVASMGLLLFLQGVHVGLLPYGRAIGEALGALPQKWLLFPFGFLLGFLTTWGEPSVRILSDQVEKASSGCLGVALIVGLGVLRIGYEIPLLYIVIPGYALVIAIAWFSDPEFLAIAIDAGGVATGPMANTFLLALALGLSSSMGRQDPILHGLGLVALIALAPIVSVMLLGFAFRAKECRKE